MAQNNAKDVEFKPALWDYGVEAEQDNLRTDEQELRTVEAIAEPMLGFIMHKQPSLVWDGCFVHR